MSLRADSGMKANRCKGVCFQTYMQQLELHHGKLAAQSVLPALSSELQTQLAYRAIVNGGWYDWEGCAGFDQSIWQDVFGGVEGALLACAVQDLRAHPK